MDAGWGVRTVRAALFAAVCVLLAALGHVLMSGVQVPGWTLAAGAAATGAAGWCLAGRERGMPTVVSVVVAAQTALHVGFSFAQGADGHAGAAGGAGGAVGSGAAGGVGHMAMHGHAGHAHSMGSMGPVGSMGSMSGMDAMDMGGGGDGMAGLGALSSSFMSSSFGMLAAHLLAALLCGLWLAHGERAAFRVLRAMAARLVAPLRLLLALPDTPDRPRRRLARGRSERVPRLLLVHAITSRGPPVGPAVA
ncbi:hypothetical protein [Streptomyces antibioticus]|uniref:hypothetical protein n=1 Tax=Streptomyces antibioticus TaxID=1890 RepID=UPI0033AB8130